LGRARVAPGGWRSGDRVDELVELLALGDHGGAAGLLGVLDVGVDEAVELGLAVDVALDQVDAPAWSTGTSLIATRPSMRCATTARMPSASR
jgi:hypothetical protein